MCQPQAEGPRGRSAAAGVTSGEAQEGELGASSLHVAEDTNRGDGGEEQLWRSRTEGVAEGKDATQRDHRYRREVQVWA